MRGLSINKKPESSGSIKEFIGKLFQSRDVAHIIHLKTSSFAQHKALNEYYDDIVDLTDSLVESFQGTNGLQDIEIPGSKYEEPVAYLTSLHSYIESNRNKVFKETYHLNIIDEILQLISSTLYKLKFLK
jgi:hypothetical protein